MLSALNTFLTLFLTKNLKLISDTANNAESFNGVYLYILIFLILVIVLILLRIYAPGLLSRIPKFIYNILAAIGGTLTALVIRKNNIGTGDDTLNEAIRSAGYSYDPRQDMFYSNIDAWQKDFGYCRLYDEAAAPSGMIIDCEPIYFEYENKRWMIEFWKGQYDLTTGCEVGIYNTKDQDIYVPGTFYGTFYYCADEADQLYIAYAIYKNDKLMFTRRGKHWWLTGFKLGEYSEPSQLTMYLNITLKGSAMRDAFISGLKKAGYSENEITIKRNTVALKFDKPKTSQPYTRTLQTDKLIQSKNKYMCDKFIKITGPYNNFPDKMKALQKQAPDLYKIILNIGRPKNLFAGFDYIKKYLTK